MSSRLSAHFSLRPLRAVRRQLSLFGAFAIGFAAVAASLHVLLPSPLLLYAAERSEKLALLAHEGERANAAAFGNSRVHVGFDPRAFDDELRSQFSSVHSLNLAIFGGSQTEQRFLAGQFLARLENSNRRPGPCIALLQIDAGVNFGVVDLFHPRSFNLYDLDTTRFAVAFSDRRIGALRLVARAGVAVSSAALHAINLGALGSLLFQTGLNPKILGAEYADDQRGMLPAQQGGAVPAPIAAIFARKPAQSASFDALMLPGIQALLAELASMPVQGGVRFVYFTLPTLEDLTQFPIYPAEIAGPGGPVPIFNLRQPLKYPELFTPEMWWDPGHLSEKGSNLASRLLAREVGNWLSSRPTAASCGG